MVSYTVQKAMVLLSCTFLGLICGTLYLYSSYSPQLAQRLQYSVTNASSIALVGNLGVACSGPAAGMVVDRKGYTVPLAVGGSLIALGYSALRWQYVAAYSNVAASCWCLFMVGTGSTFINQVCLKCCAVTFPKIRGVATSLPLALYGLSAMFYSVVASLFYAGNTAGFLAFLVWSSVAIFAVCGPAIMLCDTRKPPGARTVRMCDALDLAPHADADTKPAPAMRADLAGWRLVSTLRFWLLFAITGALAAMGQMYIYSVGYMVKALVAQPSAVAAAGAGALDALVQNQQQIQVGLLSAANCVGRLAAGIMGDVVHQSFRKPRGWLLFVPAAGLTCTQLMGQTTVHADGLAYASLLSGFFYGFTLCMMPLIVGDVFGMENFSANWGLVGLAPVVPSFYMTSLFGKIYDSNTSANDSGVATCALGKDCYAQVFRLSFGVAVFATVVVATFNFRERSRFRERRKIIA